MMHDLDGVQLYTYDEIRDMLDKAIELGLDEVLDGSVTIGQLDELVNGDAN